MRTGRLLMVARYKWRRYPRRVPVTGGSSTTTYLKVAGGWTYLYRAVDQQGQVIDVLLSVRRDLAAVPATTLQAAANDHELPGDVAGPCPEAREMEE